ncbi:hypothetical protein NQ314_003481 [Rhamnusium bicolor]|uniref:Exocyst complex component 7 n=1 Tax=Rhamnusium bicolor TaxID=1586634 RepID=A0AAV8ZLW7_9CUCU|nr:hypothetical protein NQ314_003481 [Rhamnusium bicolor]
MNLMEEKKIEISNKLEKEQANLTLLQERLSKSAQLTKGIGSILNTFEQRLSRLEDTILPVYNDTENLQKAQYSILFSLVLVFTKLLDNVISYYEVSSEVENVIEKGPGEGAMDLHNYLDALNRLASAQKYFEKNIPQSVELINVSSFFHKGSDKLNAEFKTILGKYNTPILPVVLLDLISFEDPTNNKEVKVIPKQIPDEAKSQLIQIASWLLDHGRDEYLTVYGKVRGGILQRSLTMLRNHQKSVSGGSVHGTTSSPMLNIVSRAKKCIAKHDFTTVLVIFPIFKQLRCLKPEFERTVEQYDLNVKLKFDQILQMLHSTGSKALEDFIESIRSDSVTQLPTDGTVHEMTSNVIMFLEQLLDYTDTIGIVLEQDPNYSRQLSKLKSNNEHKALLGLYIKKVLVQLNHTLISKSEQYSDSALKALFRLNNNNYVWTKLLNYIGCDDPLIHMHGDKLKDKERASLKEKFAGFNKEIDEIAKVQRGYSIPDIELRESIKRDNKELIIPVYNAFYNRSG